MNESSLRYVTTLVVESTGPTEIAMGPSSFDTLRRVMAQVSQIILTPTVAFQLLSKSSESKNRSSSDG